MNGTGKESDGAEKWLSLLLRPCKALFSFDREMMLAGREL